MSLPAGPKFSFAFVSKQLTIICPILHQSFYFFLGPSPARAPVSQVVLEPEDSHAPDDVRFKDRTRKSALRKRAGGGGWRNGRRRRIIIFLAFKVKNCIFI
jgi:hypothetical protein